MRRCGTSGLAVLAGLMLAAAGAGAQDPSDLVFWQSIQTSKNSKEFQLYLQTYPNGRFAELARLRVAELEGGTAPAAPVPGPALPPAMNAGANAGPAAPAPQPAVAAEPIPTLSITPAAVRVGQKFSVACVNFPDTSNAAYDMIVAVPAGTPMMDPGRSPEQTKVVWRMYARSCGDATSPQGGPLAPGAYELRWMSTLYNNDPGGRFEVKATTAFTVR